MDPQFEQWQKAFKAATPNVDAEKLIKQVTRAQRSMKVKAYIDLLMAVAVSIYAAYTALFLTASNWEMWGIGSLSPVALLFGIWSFSFRQKQWQMETTDVSSMLTFKRHQYQRQVTYWWYSALACAGLFGALLIIAVINIVLYATWTMWLTQLAVNGAIVAAVWVRYAILKKRLPASLKLIDEMS